MIGEEKLKLKLILAYKVGKLYLKSATSASTIADLTGISVSSIKRYLNMIEENLNDYLRLLPELGDKDYLLELQKQIDEQKAQNIIENKWSSVTELPLDLFSNEAEEIINLYNQTKPVSDQDVRETIIHLQINHFSMRKIASATGVSLGRVHKILQEEQGKTK